MVGWFGAAALALVGGLKGQGSPWRQIPLLGALAATALFISWRVRQSREKDISKTASPDDKTVVEVNTRVYLVYDEEKKLECSKMSLNQSPPTSSERESEKFTDADELGSTSEEIESFAENSQISQRQNLESEKRTGGESLSRTVNVSKGDAECKDVEEIIKAEETTHGVRTSASESSLSPASKTTDISLSGFLLPQVKSQKFFIHPEIPSVAEKGEPYVYELDTDSLKDATEDALSCPVADVTHHEKDIIPVTVSDVAPKDEYIYAFVPDEGSIQNTLSTMERLEKVLKVEDRDSASTLSRVENESGLHENENRMVPVSNKIHESPQMPVQPVEGVASSHSSALPRALDVSGMRKDEAASDRESSTLREVRATWISPELQLNDWVSGRGDSESEDGRLAHPGSAAESYPSPVAESIPGAFPFSSYISSTSESCGSDVMDSKDDFFLHSSPNNVRRIISHVKDLEPDSRQSSEEEYAERMRVYDEYLADPSLSPTMRAQVLRAKKTLERLYDSD